VDAAAAPGLAPGGAARGLVLELAGDAAAVAQDEKALGAALGVLRAEASVLVRAREAQGAGPLRVRIAALPSALPAAAERLRAAGGALLAHPARGLLWARFPLDEAPDERAADAALRAGGEAAREAGGTCRIEAAPLWVREGREVFGGSAGTLALERAVKRQYDAAAILNPGRFAGGL
jgi:FAD/FMN-containing dehydrogenase